jgi:hypothetical protein
MQVFLLVWSCLGLVQFFKTETVLVQRVRYRDEIDTCLDSNLTKNIAEYCQDLGKIWQEHPTYPLYVRTCCSTTYIHPMYRYRPSQDDTGVSIKTKV